MQSIQSLLNLAGRVAVVTGGAGYLGKTICATLAELGANVAIVDINEKSAALVAGEIVSQHRVKSSVFACDLANREDLSRVIPAVLKEFGHLEILVNCAAYVGTTPLAGWAVPFDKQSLLPWPQALAVNLTAPFALVQAAADALKVSGSGSVINIGSIYGMLGPDFRLYQGTDMGNPAAYAASKGGLLQLTRWLATALAPSVRVNMISLGGVQRAQPSEFQQRYIQRTPLQRMAVEEDIKGAVAFLATDLSSYVTGHNLVVDGGWSAW